MRIEPLDSGHAPATVAVATAAIRQTEGSVYTPAQVAVWLRGMTAGRFEGLLAEGGTLGAFEQDELLGFATFAPPDQLEFLYVDPAAWRRGVARRLVEAIEQHARSTGARELRVDASLLARPALEHMGYTVVREYHKEVGGQVFDNTWLSRTL